MTVSIEQIAQAREVAQAKLDEATAAYEGEVGKYREQILKLDIALWAMGTHTADSVTEEYVALRDKRSDLKTAYENEDKILKEAMTARECWLMEALDGIGAESLRTSHGTAYIQIKTRANCADWPSYWQYMIDNKRMDLLEKRVAQGPITKMIDNGEELPPGLNMFTERTVTVRRS